MRPSRKVRARGGPIGFSGQTADTAVGRLSGGEKARLMLGLATFAGPHLADPRRADQPSRHRQPRRADRGDQRLSRRGHPGLPRPASARRLRRPLVAGRQRAVTPFDGDLDDYRRRVLTDRSGSGAPAKPERTRKTAARRSTAQRRGPALAGSVIAAEGDQGRGRHRSPHPRDRKAGCRTRLR